MRKDFKAYPPIMPNFIRLTHDSLPEGDTGHLTVSVASLTEEEAAQYGDLMKETFMAHWRNKTRHNSRS